MFQVFVNLVSGSFMAALIGVVYILFLSEEKVLNWWFVFGQKFKDKWWHAIVWGCEKCFTGQLCLWWFLYSALKPVFSPFTPLLQVGGYNVIAHIFFICMGIAWTAVIKSILKHFKLISSNA